jgi:2-polyprenyl-6-hydroxyphenyl methylase/3-demethylubiquinone-9 3-methyltransferase
MNPVRVSFVRKQLAEMHQRSHLRPLQQLKGLSILDVGCGGGLLSESLARLGATVTSIDPSEENIAVAKAHSELSEATKGINYRVDRIEDLVQRSPESFDAVCALEVIEHVENPDQFIQNCLKALKPKGSLFLSTMNRTKKSYAMAILGAEYIMNLLPPGTHDWNKFITPEELQVMIEKVEDSSNIKGRLVLHRGIVMSPSLRISSINCLPWSISDTDLDVNYISHAIRL